MHWYTFIFNGNFFFIEIKRNKLKSTNYIKPRLGHSGTVYQNKYIIFGGRYYNSNIFASLDIYNITLGGLCGSTTLFLF